MLNVNLLCNALFYSYLKRANNKKGKQKEKMHRKVVFLSIKKLNFANLFIGARVKNIEFF